MKTGRDKAVLQAFGQAVRERRLELGLSQEKLAELSDLHRTYIADIERGTRNLGLINVVKIAHALNSAPSALLNRIPTPVNHR